MVTRIEINPNLRLPGHLTMVDLHEDAYGDRPVVNMEVEVFESASGLVGRGWITSIEPDEDIAYIQVEWNSLRIPQTSGDRVEGSLPELPPQWAASAWASMRPLRAS